MTLEDFFTLTEMKGGLTAPARVKELVNVMHREKDCIVKNIGDMTRQWSTVASTIIATEDKDCLELFIQLDGLWFIDRWLKDAQKYSIDASDNFVESSITALLRALEKLQVGYEKSLSSGILVTVENLINHGSSRVQDGAKALYDRWKKDGDNDTALQDGQRDGASNHPDGKSAELAGAYENPECSSGDTSLPRGSAREEKHVQLRRKETTPSVCTDVLLQERVDDLQRRASDKDRVLDQQVTEDEHFDLMGSSLILKPTVEKSPGEESVISSSEGTPNETSTPVVLKQGIEGRSNGPESNDCADEKKQLQTRIPSNESGAMEFLSVSSLLEPRSLRSPGPAKALESVSVANSQTKTDSSHEDCQNDSANAGMGKVVTVQINGKDNTESPNNSRGRVVSRNPVYNSDVNVMQESYDNEFTWQKSKHADATSSMEDDGEVDGVQEHASDDSEDLATNLNFLKPAVSSKVPDLIDKKKSDIELDYSMVDALEVARQVAIEVEREVVDHREPSCSSEKISENVVGQPHSPESRYGKEIKSIDSSSRQVPTGPNVLDTSSKREASLSSGETLNAKMENCLQETESSQDTEAAQEPEVNSEKGLVNLDLNQEFYSEDMDQPEKPIAAHISLVSASRAAAFSGLPASPLQFEGAPGWKGSAATSAFRPASPRRILEGDKTPVCDGSGNGPKQRHHHLDFDLNVAEDGGDKSTDVMPANQVLVSTPPPCVESSVEHGRKGLERPKLDLNLSSDDGDAPSDHRMDGWLFNPWNGHHSSLPFPSSPSMQPSLKNFDLNYQPSSDLQPHLGKSSAQNIVSAGGLKSDGSIISIMGTKVQVRQKDFVSQTVTLPSGRVLDLEPAPAVNLARTGGFLGIGSSLPYAHVGYGGRTTGSTIPFSLATHGQGDPMSYMVDSRGAPIITQIVGSSAPPTALSQSPLLMMGMQPGSYGAGSSQHNFDLNSGLKMDGGSRESVGLRQFLNSGQNRLVDEHLRGSSQPSGYGLGKRKEPEGGWEPYPSNLKHHQPPWK